MDEATINKKGKEPLIKLLNQFDLYKDKSKYGNVDELTSLIADLHRYSVNTLFQFEVTGDYTNPDLNVLAIGQPDLLLLTEQYKNEMIVSVYKAMIMETLNLLFKEDQNKDRNIEEMTNKIVEFEFKLSNITLPSYVIVYSSINI